MADLTRHKNVSLSVSSISCYICRNKYILILSYLIYSRKSPYNCSNYIMINFMFWDWYVVPKFMESEIRPSFTNKVNIIYKTHNLYTLYITINEIITLCPSDFLFVTVSVALEAVFTIYCKIGCKLCLCAVQLIIHIKMLFSAMFYIYYINRSIATIVDSTYLGY